MGGNQTFSVEVPEEFVTKLEEKAKAHNMSVEELISYLIKYQFTIIEQGGFRILAKATFDPNKSIDAVKSPVILNLK